jgi:hypothetical protein
MVKPRTGPHGGKPHHRPEHGHAVMTEAEQAKFLGRPNEIVSNLGHPSREDDLTRHPLNKVPNYEPNSNRVVDGPARSVGVYGRYKNPQSGISTAQNLDRWSDYARSNSYHRGPGPGKEPTVRDPRGSTVPSAARNKASDGSLASPKEWAKYEYGSDSGLGRLEKAGK